MSKYIPDVKYMSLVINSVVKITIRHSKMFNIIISMRQPWIIFVRRLRGICEVHFLSLN